MNTDEHDSGEEFARLRQLLALKRHEQPPPGYFDRLPGQIMHRIKAAEAERVRPWYERWFSMPLSRPALAIGYASIAMMLFAGAMLVGNMVDSGKQAGVVQPEAAPVKPPPLLAETNETPSPPAFLVRPGTQFPDGGFRDTNTLPAGFKKN